LFGVIDVGRKENVHAQKSAAAIDCSLHMGDRSWRTASSDVIPFPFPFSPKAVKMERARKEKRKEVRGIGVKI